MGFSGIDHWFDSESHSWDDLNTFSTSPVMQNLRVFVETPADPVSAVLSDHRETFGFRIVLNNRPDISEMRPRLDHGDTQLKTFFGRF